jgi:GT2 family glycosyltransferase
VIVVSFNSQRWLEGCFSSLARQTHSNLEIILVDNASQDDSLIWTQAHYSQVNCLRLEQVASFAAALNYGLAQARGQFLLLLNPDVTLEPDAIAHLLAAARAHPGCGAVAPKLRLLWAPAFLNGLGNQVGALLWGSDVAQGALDVGQLDDLPELPSACFAAALIPRPVLEAVGLVDEGFPMYYEDSEWSYRARLLGYAIVPAPQAVIYHAFSSRVPEGQPLSLPSLKLRRLAYGRLRWATKLLSGAWRVRFTLPYRLEDLLRMAAALARGHKDTAAAHWAAWADLRRDAPEIAAARQALDGRRKCTYPALFAPQRHLPPPRVWRGLPLLTIDIILADLSPWLAERASLKLPEWQVLPALLPPPDRPPGAWRRMRDVLRREGRLALLLRMAKAVARRLARP